MLRRFTSKLTSQVTELPDPKGRLEIKFVFPGRMLSTVLLRVLMHPMVLASTYPPRRVNNIYFDSPELTALRIQRDGLSDRAKVRLRWYGDTERMAQPVLELKSK